MTPIRHPDTTHELGKPVDWDDREYGPCECLPVVRSEGVFYSYWRPTWRDRLAILIGRYVRLSVVAGAHPPVMLDTEA